MALLLQLIPEPQELCEASISHHLMVHPEVDAHQSSTTECGGLDIIVLHPPKTIAQVGLVGDEVVAPSTLTPILRLSSRRSCVTFSPAWRLTALDLARRLVDF